MKNKFRTDYNDDELEVIWSEAVFVFDTNVLLHLYESSPKTRAIWLNLLGGIKNQGRKLWLPYQFAFEYQRHIITIASDIQAKYDVLIKQCLSVKTSLEYYKTRHGFDVKRPIKRLKQALKELETLADSHHKSLKDPPPIQDQVSDLFESSIGDDYHDTFGPEIAKIGETRYARKIPPGFKDSNKPAPYGDLIAWFQMISFAKREGKPIIMVTDDSRGDDWFYKSKDDSTGRTTVRGPRPELLWEMREKANVDFYLYRTGEFIASARKFLNLEDVLSEQQVQKQEERDKDVVELEDFEERITDIYGQGPASSSLDFHKMSRLSSVDFDQITGLSSLDFDKITGLSSVDFDKIAGLSSIDFDKIAGLSSVDFDKIAGLSSIDFDKITGLSSVDVDKITGLSSLDFDKIAGLSSFDRNKAGLGSPKLSAMNDDSTVDDSQDSDNGENPDDDDEAGPEVANFDKD